MNSVPTELLTLPLYIINNYLAIQIIENNTYIYIYIILYTYKYILI